MTSRGKLDEFWMRRALALARRGLGRTSPNPMVGAVIVKRGRCLGEGWHHKAGLPHAEIEALNEVRKRGHDPRGATLYVTLEPCSTFGRTPPCTDAIRAAGLARVVVGAVDPNPRHAGGGLDLLRQAGIEVVSGVCAEAATTLNEAFNHWITRRTPFVVVKAAMTLDGKIATASGESKWITGPAARAVGMRLRRASGAILVGVDTVLADDPSLTVRGAGGGGGELPRRLPQPLRIVLDSRARTPLSAKVVRDASRDRTRLVVTDRAPARRVLALGREVEVWNAPSDRDGRVDLDWVLEKLGREGVTQLLVEGGGEVHASFLLARRAQRVAFFYAPLVLGGAKARRAVAGAGAVVKSDLIGLTDLRWRRVGEDLLLSARIGD